MTQEEKQLLLVDLCARLPYDTIISVNNGKYREDVKLHPHYIFDWDADRWDAKPYLRPMSSMTADEKQIMDNLWKDNNKLVFADPGEIRRYRFYDISVVDFLNSNHFDYRGLIQMGLALEAKEGMYK